MLVETELVRATQCIYIANLLRVKHLQIPLSSGLTICFAPRINVPTPHPNVVEQVLISPTPSFPLPLYAK